MRRKNFGVINVWQRMRRGKRFELKYRPPKGFVIISYEKIGNSIHILIEKEVRQNEEKV